MYKLTVMIPLMGRNSTSPTRVLLLFLILQFLGVPVRALQLRVREALPAVHFPKFAIVMHSIRICRVEMLVATDSAVL